MVFGKQLGTFMCNFEREESHEKFHPSFIRKG